MDALSTLLASVFITLVIGLPWLFALLIPIGGIAAAATLAFKYNMMPYFAEVGALAHKVKLSILVADDDEISVVPLVTALADRPVDVKLVESGSAVLSELKKKHYDLLFLDMLMPGKNGDETIREAELLTEVTKKLPVIFYTSHKDTCMDLLGTKLEKTEIKGIWEKRLPISTIVDKIDALLGEIALA